MKRTKQEKMKKNHLIYIILAIISILSITTFIYTNHKNRNIESNKKENNITDINKQVDILVGGYNQVITVKSLTKDILINEDKYIRLDMEIDNKKNIDAITSLHQFILVNDNDEELTICYHEGMIDTELPNVLSNKLIANGKTSGYLYCPMVSDISRIKIKVISGGKIGVNNEITYEYKDYYIDLR